jgi:NAD(P)-dependent dehydrogenase (short-subunit alcohol dehydrogenase family)
VPTALITGASRGFGLAVADVLVRRGWRVIGDARDAAALELAAGTVAHPERFDVVPGDVADGRHRRHLAEAAARSGGLDLLVHNASTLGASPLPPLDEVGVRVAE